MTDSTCPNSLCRYRNRVTGYCSYTGPCIDMVPMEISVQQEESKVPEGLTKIGYDEIIRRIMERPVRPPTNMTVEPLNAWMQGYVECQNAVIEMLVTLKDQYGR